MKSRARDFRIITLLIGSCLTFASTAHEQPVEYHVFTPAQLVQAIDAANSSTAPAIIFVFPREYQLSGAFDSEFGPSALPPIRSNITLVGRDVAKTILRPFGVGPVRRIFTVLAVGRLTVRKVTLTGGAANDDFPFPASTGGAAGNFGGFLRFQDCVLTGNQASSESQLMEGGAVFSRNGRLEIIRTTISDNGVTGGGGGIALRAGSGVIRDSIIRDNENFGIGAAIGAGIYVSGTLGIYGSTIADNRGLSTADDNFADGGAIFIAAGSTVIIADSAVVRNFVGEFEPTALGVGSGGGIYNAGTLMIKNGTIGGNRAGTSGGGIFNRGFLRLQGATVTDNAAFGETLPADFFDHIYPPGCDLANAPELCITGGGGVWNAPAARANIAGSVIANNRVEPLAFMLGPDCAGTFTSLSHNALSTDTDCVLKPAVKGTNTNDLINVDPRLAALADDGTAGNAHHPLRVGSPLIDAGGVVGPRCTFRDQLGQRRVDGDHEGNVLCDIGAIEFKPTSQ
jgi:hypothetical protein